VKIGRNVYLKRDDIRFSVTEKGDECRVEVVRNDPITQRVGYVEPHALFLLIIANNLRHITCDGESPCNNLQYKIHRNSSLLQHD
jgi:hypothetical protein